MRDGYKIYSSINGVHLDKREIDFQINGRWGGELSGYINDYAFIKDRIPLSYLTIESKNKLIEWANENNIIYRCE